jgi:sulfite reductase (ferredoxin)
MDMDAIAEPAPVFDDLSEGQIVGPTKPGHMWEKPWTNLESQEHVQVVKAASGQLMEPLLTDMGDDEIFVSGDSIHILKHHGSYMQQDRSLKGPAKKSSYQFMLRLKMPCGEVPGPLYAELDDISNKWGHGDLRATTRQAFQLHGVLKGNLKSVIAAIANIGSNTYGGCGDISRNVMTPPVQFANNPAYTYCNQYARAMAELFKPMTNAFYEIWLDGKPAEKTEYWQRDIGKEHLGVDLAQVRTEDRGNGIITGHPIEPLYGRTYLPKKFKIAFTVPGDNGVDLYINDIGCVVIMEPDGKTLAGFNIVVGGGMGRTHKAEQTFARAASHLGYVPKEHYFEAMKAILAVQRDHGNREVRSNARLKYLVHTLGIDDFRTLTEKYFGREFEPWRTLPEWKYIDWMGWHEQGDGNWMLGVNVEQGRVRDTPELRLKTGLRKVVDTFPGVDMTLTPSQSIVLRNIRPKDRDNLESLLRFHGVQTKIEEIDPITRKSIACPAFPLCGLAITEAERVQPMINQRLYTQLIEMGLSNTEFVTRTTGCPNGCARPYMAELAFVGSGPNMYQVWLGGHPAQSERTAEPVPSLFKMNLDKLEETMEPIFAMFKSQRVTRDEAFGTFCHRVGIPAIEDYMKSYQPGAWREEADPFAPPSVKPDATVGISSELLAKVEEQARARGYDVNTLLDTVLREAFDIDEPEVDNE